MGKVKFHSKVKKMGKHKHFKFKGFLNFSYQAEIHLVPETWKKWISIAREKYGKTQTFQIYGFLKYFEWSRNPYNAQNMGKVNLHSTWKVWENTDFPYSLLPRRFKVDDNPCNSQCLEMYKFPQNANILWKTILFPGCGFLRKLEVITKPKQSTDYE